jgi:adenylosuccinate synthase
MREFKIDVIVGLQSGDEGKGKITHHLLKSGKYTHCVRYNGGGNAGHTIYHNGKKFVTHYIPAGVFFGIKSIIGPGCVINIPKFLKEIEYLNKNGIDTDGLIHIANNTHITTEMHVDEDTKDKDIGTTKTGNGPTYRDKYDRKGIRAESFNCLRPYLLDFYAEFHECEESVYALFEGAQGFQLDVDWGDYPYVTSSHCTTAGALLNGIPPQAVSKVWGVAKAYETYVGAKDFEPNDKVFSTLRELGSEFGATTGRPRQCNWLNVQDLKRSVCINGITSLVMNKMDILRTLQKWVVYDGEDIVEFENEEGFKEYIMKALTGVAIHFSDNPHGFENDVTYFMGGKPLKYLQNSY